MQLKAMIGGAVALLLSATACPPVMAQWACTRDPWSSVNLRRGPGQNHGIVASIPNGSSVRPLSWVYGGDGWRWFRVESGGLVGYSRSDYICF